MAPLPLLKIAAVLWKEVSKPLAAYIKKEAHLHPTLRTFSMMLGRNHELLVSQVEHVWEHKRWNRNPKPIPESAQFSVGADLIVNGFLLSTAISLVLFEYWRASVQKEAENVERAAKKLAKSALREARLLDIERAVARLEAKVMEDGLWMEDMHAKSESLERRMASERERELQ